MSNTYDIAKVLSNYIQLHPYKFKEITTKLVDKYISKISLNLDQEEVKKLKIIYQFIVMYSLITKDLHTVKKMMHNSKITLSIIKALTISYNLKLNHHKLLINTLHKFGKEHVELLNTNSNIILGCLYFDADIFYSVIESINGIYCNNHKYMD